LKGAQAPPPFFLIPPFPSSQPFCLFISFSLYLLLSFSLSPTPCIKRRRSHVFPGDGVSSSATPQTQPYKSTTKVEFLRWCVSLSTFFHLLFCLFPPSLQFHSVSIYLVLSLLHHKNPQTPFPPLRLVSFHAPRCYMFLCLITLHCSSFLIMMCPSPGARARASEAHGGDAHGSKPKS
jgi:hypothetical protein